MDIKNAENEVGTKKLRLFKVKLENKSGSTQGVHEVYVGRTSLKWMGASCSMQGVYRDYTGCTRANQKTLIVRVWPLFKGP